MPRPPPSACACSVSPASRSARSDWPCLYTAAPARRRHLCRLGFQVEKPKEPGIRTGATTRLLVWLLLVVERRVGGVFEVLEADSSAGEDLAREAVAFD
jgi:hypothetical protein